MRKGAVSPHYLAAIYHHFGHAGNVGAKNRLAQNSQSQIGLAQKLKEGNERLDDGRTANQNCYGLQRWHASLDISRKG
ncbi:MAG: hypothetical protein A2214_00460 [Candidatus Harrisonbacteria bacterium RIFOXYA1_FULL_48_8]|uniref:Uncharacterized protein n=2 Tax=Candidatus Harrisoniibacteriota TaxID=1817905 RepID=A0A1G1ZV99_9BACT|nr:MAG: hypothetical protein A3E64_01485 [Candidatus Harrisonbacteria bacterium RIFCSPHIGHO2_12_FULL_48_16]OGY68395.1 MAG: hypothetical protein A2214_00460 [Candidatus Harrisonbacteria bacterium RIFOXYA1_FULL_48_8]